MSAPYDLEMECYCQHCKCDQHVKYMHHDDWSEEDDWACQKCIEACYKLELLHD